MRFIIAILLFCQSAFAASTFYVDADWSGTQTGAAATPWQNLSGSQWTTIATAMGSGPVTIYCNARQAGVNTTMDMTSASSSAFGVNRLTIDGSSFYNSSE